MSFTHNLGFPAMGHRRELKKALELFWQGQSTVEALENVARELRAKHWRLQKEAGIESMPVGDFSYYDRMLDMVVLLGATPERFGFSGKVDFQAYFAMARGSSDKRQPAMEMTKWFDTNYHYIVPEFTQKTAFSANPERLLAELDEALAQNVPAKPVLIGPLTFLYLGKEKEEGVNRLALLPKLLPVYAEILEKLKARGIEWVQIDEPVLTLDLPSEWLAQLEPAYRALRTDKTPKLLLSTYFESVEDLAPTLQKLPIDGLHLDLVRAPQQLERFLSLEANTSRVLSLGVVDGRNIWRADLRKALATLEQAKKVLGDRLWVAPSCSLLHVPIDLEQETRLDPEIQNWLAFGLQKLAEVQALSKALNQGPDAVRSELEASDAAAKSRATSARIHNPALQERIKNLPSGSDRRKSPFPKRQSLQKARYKLPVLPTTTIGSFPQTTEVRELRSALRKGRMTQAEYETAIRNEIQSVIRKQEAMGLDVLVHGEPERNDMVEYFGEQLAGFVFTQHGWVQSYGSRCVKPPIIYGDVYRPQPMTVEWSRYAQSLTQKPVKGMLTGPVTILQWSFYRNDQSREATATQIALAILDEVQDLEQAGISIIQIDEPAYREGLPLKRKDWDSYLEWASRVFRVSSSGVADETQIHTHMCYSEFNDILPAIAAMDADVITIEASRSDLELFARDFSYPNEIGPGVYDVHSPAIPETEAMAEILEKMSVHVPLANLWVNPDCGLKTRRWEEVEPALQNMVAAAGLLRKRLAQTSGNLAPTTAG